MWKTDHTAVCDGRAQSATAGQRRRAVAPEDGSLGAQDASGAPQTPSVPLRALGDGQPLLGCLAKSTTCQRRSHRHLSVSGLDANYRRPQAIKSAEPSFRLSEIIDITSLREQPNWFPPVSAIASAHLTRDIGPGETYSRQATWLVLAPFARTRSCLSSRSVDMAARRLVQLITCCLMIKSNVTRGSWAI